MFIASLSDRAVLSVTGADAKGFLQGLITNDLEQAGAGAAVYAMLLTPQGKVIADFFVIGASDGGYRIDVRQDLAADLLKRLKMYRLRAAVELADLSESVGVFAQWGAGPADALPTGALAYDDPRLVQLGRRGIVARAALPGTTADYEAFRITLGVPATRDLVGQFILDANGEELHGVDFRKGCYVGQEVTARMKHKAGPRKRLLPLASGDAALADGASVQSADGGEVGTVLSVAGGTAMASLRVDRLTPHTKLLAGGVPVSIIWPAYAMPALSSLKAAG